MPFTPITFGSKNPASPRLSKFNWPVTFYDRVTFVGPDSSVEFLGGRIVGDLMSANWDGAMPPTLRDATATKGFYIDSEVGEAQFMGDVFVGGLMGIYDDLYLASGGAFRTTETAGISGAGIVISYTDRNYIRFYTDDADEYTGGILSELVSGTGATRTLQFSLRSPAIDQDDYVAALAVRSGSYDGSSFAPAVVVSRGLPSGGTGTGQTPEFRIQNNIPMFTDGNITMFGTDPEVWFDLNENNGIWFDTSTVITYIKASGAHQVRISGSGLEVASDNAGAFGYGGALIQNDAGLATYPTYSFIGDSDTGMYRKSYNSIGWSTAGVERMQLGTVNLNFNAAATGSAAIRAGGVGAASTPAFTFAGDLNTGMYQKAADSLGFATAGNERLYIASGGSVYFNYSLFALSWYNTTTTIASNAYISSVGQIKRSTSAARYKTEIVTADLADVTLRPVRYRSKAEGTTHYGLIADEVAAALPEAGSYNQDGEIENYDDRAITAVLVAKINRLEAKLEALNATE